MNVGVDVKKRVTRRRKKMRKRLATTPSPPRFNSLKVNAVFVEFKKGEEYQLKNFKTSNEIITPTTNFDEFYEELVQNILNEIEEFKIRGSQWVLNQILNLELRINRYNPIRGGSYMPLPPTLANKKAIINIKNRDNKRFLWAVLAALHPANKHAQGVIKYKQWEREFDDAVKSIEFPVKLSDVSKYAKRTNISINVYTFDTKRIFPLEISKEEKKTHRSIVPFRKR